MKERIKNWAYNWRFILLSFGTSLGVMLLIAFCYSMIPFGDITILRMDLYHQYGPLLAELYDRLTHFESLIYSWTSGGGGSFLGNYNNYLSSPLSLLILLFGHKNTTECIAAIITLKAALSSSTLTYYFKESKQFKAYGFITAGFGVLYAFSGFFVAYYWNFMWLDGMMLLPLIVLGIEKIFDGEESFTYIISLALLMFSSYYMAYMCCIFSVLYAITYVVGNVEPSKKVFKSIAKYAGSSVLSGLLAAAALLPTYFCLKSCSATSDTFPTVLENYFNIFDFLCQHLAGLEPTIRSSGDSVLPNIYCGIITVMMGILYFYLDSIPLKEKISRFFLLLVLFLSIDLNYLNNIWHAFHFPNDLPWRFSYCYSFVLITIAAKALLRIKEFSSKEILSVGIGVALFIIAAEEIGSPNVKMETIIISLIFTALYVIVLRIMQDKRFQVAALSGLMFCLMFAEIAVANTDNYDIDQPKSNYTDDYKDFKVLKAALDKLENNEFYRMELSSLRTRMDNSWYGYNGMSVFSSMAYERSANLQSNLGMFSNYINSYTYNPQTPVYNAMFSLKYVVDNTNETNFKTKYYKEIKTVDKYTAYENLYCLPIAFCVDDNILYWNTSFANPFDVQNDFFENATGLSDVFKPVNITECQCFNVNDIDLEEANSGSFVFQKQNTENSASITLKVEVDKTENIYLYAKSSNITSITVRGDNTDMLKTQNIEEAYILDLGVHDAGEIFYIDLPISEGDSGFIDAYVYAIDDEIFEEGYEKLSSSPLNVTKMTDTKIVGTVDAKEKCMLYTSINYDDSWDVYVDGKKLDDTQIFSLGDALLGIELTEGQHTVEFKYHAQGLAIGIAISSAAIVLLVLLFVYSKTKKKEVTVNEEVPPIEIPEELG